MAIHICFFLISCDPNLDSKGKGNSDAKDKSPDSENLEPQKKPEEKGNTDAPLPNGEPDKTPDPNPNDDTDSDAIQDENPEENTDENPEENTDENPEENTDGNPEDPPPPVNPKGSCEKAIENGWLLCEDFESSAIDETRWQVRKSGLATGEVFEHNSFHGKNSLKVTWEKNDASGYSLFRLDPLNIFPLKENRLFGRGFLYLESFNIEMSYDYLFEISTRNVTRLFTLGLSNEGFFSAYIPGASPPIKTAVEKRHKATTKQWLCVEWEFNGLNQEILFWIDGIHQKDLDLNRSNVEYIEIGSLSNFWDWLDFKGTIY